MAEDLLENTVQKTLCIPLWGRMMATKKYPDFFPDYEAERIETYIKDRFNGNIQCIYGCSLGGSFRGLIAQRKKIHIMMLHTYPKTYRNHETLKVFLYQPYV